MLHLEHLLVCFVDLALSKVVACLLDNCVGKQVNVLLQKHYCFSWKKKNQHRTNSLNCGERPSVHVNWHGQKVGNCAL